MLVVWALLALLGLLVWSFLALTFGWVEFANYVTSRETIFTSSAAVFAVLVTQFSYSTVKATIFKYADSEGVGKRLAFFHVTVMFLLGPAMVFIAVEFFTGAGFGGKCALVQQQP